MSGLKGSPVRVLATKQKPARSGAEARVESFYTGVGPWSVHARRSLGEALPEGLTPVVLVHGVVVSGHYMKPTLKALGRYRRVYAPDLPGFGRSSGPRRSPDVPELAGCLADWLRAAGIGKAVVVAHSTGCQFAVELAAREPELVERLVLLGPTGNPENRSSVVQVWRWVLDCFQEPLGVWVSYAEGFLSLRPRRSIGILRHSMRGDMAEKLPLLKVPALVVRGSRDPISSPRWMEKMVDLLPNGRCATIPDAPHDVNYATPEGLTEVLRSFLEETV